MKLTSFLLLVSMGVLAAADPRLAAQASGTPRKVSIRFESAPTGARFEFSFGDQKVTGTTPATKVFTLVDGRKVTVAFQKRGFQACTKTFVTRWPTTGEAGTLAVGEEEQPLAFSARAKPPVVSCELKPATR